MCIRDRYRDKSTIFMRENKEETMSKELAKTYNPKEIEDKTYEKWCENKYFHAEIDRSRKPFTTVMPPPNITGKLHMGHALDNTLQDILIRYKRMEGDVYKRQEVDGIQLKDAAQFAVLVEECEKILFKNVYVHNRKNRNTDGFHFSWNRNITIQSCKLDCGDDAIVLNRNAVNVEIKDCDISSRWAGIRRCV